MTEEPSAPRLWCPGCEPNVDQVREYVSPQPCSEHSATAGCSIAVGVADTDAETNRRFCDLLHRGIVE